MFACGVGQTQGDGSLSLGEQFRLDACEDTVSLGESGCGHFNGYAVGGKTRVDGAVPEFQFLVDAFQFCEFQLPALAVGEFQSECAEIQSVGIHAEIVGGLLLAPSLLVLYGIHLLMAVAEIEGTLRFLWGELLVVGEGVPSPVRHGGQGHPVLIVLGIALQTGHVNGGGKMSVAKTKRSQWAGFSYDGIVS